MDILRYVRAPHQRIAGPCRNNILRNSPAHASSSQLLSFCASGSWPRARSCPPVARLPTCVVRTRSERKVAIIDMGTNSWKLLIAQVRSDGKHMAVQEDKETVRLLTGSTFEEIGAAATTRAIEALRRFTGIAARHRAHVVAVATAGVRDARNSAIFLDRVTRQFGFPVHVISGVQEARLVYRGMLQSFADLSGGAVALDIGGGSTEVIVGRGQVATVARSAPVGHLRLLETAMPTLAATGVVCDSELANCRGLAAHMLASSALSDIVAEQAAMIALGESFRCIGTAGTIKAVHRFSKLMPGGNQFEISAQNVEGMLVQLAGTSRGERLALSGMRAKRVDTIVPGAVLLLEVMRCLRIQRLEVAETGLREGLLSEAASALAAGTSFKEWEATALDAGACDGHLPLGPVSVEVQV